MKGDRNVHVVKVQDWKLGCQELNPLNLSVVITLKMFFNLFRWALLEGGKGVCFRGVGLNLTC